MAHKGWQAHSELERFWQLVQKADGDGCWEWIGGFYETGYGRFAPQLRGHYRAHRYSWILQHGPIPAGRFVLHRCDNRRCVRQSHLFLGTQADNMADAAAKQRVRRRGNHPLAKITQARADEIRAVRSATGLSYAKIAQQFAVSHATVQRVCTRAARGGWA